MKLLIADDAAVARISLQRQLVRWGHEVVAAADGEEAWGILRSDPGIQALVTDWSMPRMDGVELCRRARELRRPRYLPIAVLTARDEDGDLAVVLEAGADSLLVKPADPDILRAQLGVMRRILDLEDRLAAQVEEIERSHFLVSRMSAAEIEQRRRHEEELERLASGLEERVAERTRELERANVELLDLARLKSAFFAVTSHELRTPLTVIKGMLPLIGALSPNAPEGVRQMIASATRAADRLNRTLVRSLRHLEQGLESAPLLREPTAPRDLVRDATEMVLPLAQARKQQFQIDVADDLPSPACDREKVVDALTNLLVNAIKFTPDGGSISLLVRPVPGRREVEFSVLDSGTGIRTADRPHVFDDFFTSLAFEKHSSGDFEFDKRGIGLGLATARRFVEMHGGRIGFESEEGRGSRFHFTLPADDPDLDQPSRV